MNTMNAVEQTGLNEKARAEHLIEAAPALPEVESFEVRLDEDWTGDPSLYITFRIKPDTVFDKNFYKRFNSYSNSVSFSILHSGISRFPYTRLEIAV